MIPASLVERAIRRRVSHVTVGDVLYRVESVDAAKLAGVGHAYLQGLAEALPEVTSDAEATIRAESADEAEAAARIAEYRERERDRAMRAHRAVLATEAGAEAYLARVRAYVLAGVTGLGEPPEALTSPAPGVPGVEHHGASWEPPTPLARVRIVDVPPPDGEPVADVLRRHADAGEWPLWAVPPADCAILATVIAQLAGGRADVVAPFRVGSPASADAGEAG